MYCILSHDQLLLKLRNQIKYTTRQIVAISSFVLTTYQTVSNNQLILFTKNLQNIYNKKTIYEQKQKSGNSNLKGENPVA